MVERIVGDVAARVQMLDIGDVRVARTCLVRWKRETEILHCEELCYTLSLMASVPESDEVQFIYP